MSFTERVEAVLRKHVLKLSSQEVSGSGGRNLAEQELKAEVVFKEAVQGGNRLTEVQILDDAVNGPDR